MTETLTGLLHTPILAEGMRSGFANLALARIRMLD
jgi:hypothetical protein